MPQAVTPQSAKSAAQASVDRMGLAKRAQEFLLEHEEKASATITAAWHRAWAPVVARAEAGSLDLADLNHFRNAWGNELSELLEQLGELYKVGAMSAMQVAGMLPDAGAPVWNSLTAAAQPAEDPKDKAVPSVAERLDAGVASEPAVGAFDAISKRSVDYLSGAANRLKNVGDHAWLQARAALTQGMVQGEPLAQLRDRLMSVLGSNDKRSMLIARTEVHKASTEGSVDGMRALGDNGLKFKTWVAVMDDRTREAHAEADGQTVELDDAFDVGGDSYDVPDDPNCRCVLTYGNSPDGDDDAVGDGSWQDDPDNPDGPMQWVPKDTTLQDDATTMHTKDLRAVSDADFSSTLSAFHACTSE